MKIHEIAESRPGRKKVETLYHGTSSTFLPSIKKHGLLPDTGQQSYGVDDGPSFESYGGVYLTSDMHIAEDAAEVASLLHGGDPMIITVQYVLGSGGLDEDFVLGLVFKYINKLENIDPILRDLQNKIGKLNRHVRVYVIDLIERVQDIKLTNGIYDEDDFDDYIRGDSKIRSIVKQIMEISKNRRIPNGLVRVARPIKFKGKTRIIDIMLLNKARQ